MVTEDMIEAGLEAWLGRLWWKHVSSQERIERRGTVIKILEAAFGSSQAPMKGSTQPGKQVSLLQQPVDRHQPAFDLLGM